MVIKLLIILLLFAPIAEAQTSQAILYGHVSDDGVRHVRIDKHTRALTTINYEHHEVHAGSHYILTSFVDIPSGNDTDLVISTPNTTKWIHMLFQADVEGESTLSVFEDVVADNDGTQLTAINSDRNSNNTTGLFLSSDSTITNEGMLIALSKRGSGKGAGGGIRATEELILKQNTKYVFRISNDVVSQSTWTSFQLTWYEHTNKD